MNAITFHPTVFGKMAKYPFPEGYDIVVLCVDRHQHVPVTLLLPHQVYLEKLRELLAEYPDARGITLIPCKSSDKVMIDKGVIHDEEA